MATIHQIVDHIFNPRIIVDYFELCERVDGGSFPAIFPFQSREHLTIRWHTTFVTMAVAFYIFPSNRKELTQAFYDHIANQKQIVRVGDFVNMKHELAAVKPFLGISGMFSSPVNKNIELSALALAIHKLRFEGLSRVIMSSNHGLGPKSAEDFIPIGWRLSASILISYWGRELDPIADSETIDKLSLFIAQHLAPLLVAAS